MSNAFAPARIAPAHALAGWLLLVPVEIVAALVRGGAAGTSKGAWLVAHLVGAGHLLFAGLASAGAVALFRLAPPRYARLGWGVLAAAAAVLGWLAIGMDFEGFVARVPAVASVPPGLFGAAAGVVPVVGAALVARVLPARLAWAGLVLAAALAFANNFVLELDYPGIHLAIGAAAAAAATVALARLAPPALAPSRRMHLALLGAAPIAIAALVIRPGDAAWRTLLETPGAFLAPFVSQLMPELAVAGGDGDDPWMKSRAKVPPAPPSGLSPLGDDGIVILVVMDAVRADVVARDAPLVAMPNLDKVRRRAVEFTQARSAAPSTLSSITTLFTGKFYSQLHAKKSRDEDVSGDETPRVAELLAGAGVKPFHVVPTRLLHPKKGATRGFEFVELPEKSTSDRVLPELQEHFDGGMPGRHLIYLHWMDAHSPYDLAGKEGGDRAAYLREVAIVDAQLGKLLAMVDAAGLAERTTLILTADHGEAFGADDHDTFEHGKTVYEELLRVPLIIAAPGKRPRVVDAPVSLVDLGATLLDAFGQPVPGYFMGESLLPLAYGHKARVGHPIAAEAGQRLRAFYSTDDVKVVFDRTRKTTELYDLSRDAEETKNLADEESSKKHIDRGRRFFSAHQAGKGGGG